MLSGVQIYTSDNVWRKILSDLHADVLDAPNVSAVNLDLLQLDLPVSLPVLRTAILGAADNMDAVERLLGAGVILPRLQARIVTLLYKSGGMSAAELKNALGYAPGVATHAVDTAIYQLRRAFGRDFIENKDGIYRIGRV